jgi:dihydrofolate reductase
MTLAIIAAVADSGVIGRGGELPWHLPADLKHFKALTTGHSIIMGRRTFESIGRPLPNRRSIVITRDASFHPAGVEVVHAFGDAMRLVSNESQSFVIGGAEVFRTAFPYATELFLTRVHAEVEGDTLFPEFEEREWELVEDEHREADTANPHPLSFQRYRRR